MRHQRAADRLPADACMLLLLCWKLMVSALVPPPPGPLALLWVAQLAEPITVTVCVLGAAVLLAGLCCCGSDTKAAPGG